MDKIIQGIENKDETIKYVKALGKRHVKYGVIKHHYWVVGRAVLTTLEAGLAESFTKPIKQHWVKFLQLLTNLMIDDHYEELIHIDKSIILHEDHKFQII